MLASLRWLLVATSVILLVYVGAHVPDLGLRAIQTETAVDGALLVLFSLVLLLLQRRLISVRWANVAVVIVGWLILGSIIVSGFLTHGSSDLGLIPLVVIGAGIFLLSTRALLVGLLGTVVVSFPAAYALSSHPSFVSFSLLLAAGLVLSVAVHTARMRYHRQTYALRQRDAERAEELADALRRLEEEFEEHKRTEVERKHLEGQFAMAQKMEAVGQLAGGVAHDMNNVLGMIMSLASLIRAESDLSEITRDDIDQILEATRRGSSLTKDLLGFARRGPMATTKLDLREVVQQTVKLLHRTIPKGITLDVEVPEERTPIEGDEGQLSQVLLNLCLNAVDALHGRGRLAISLATIRGIDDAGSDNVRLRVRDDGDGMTPEVVERAFEPFYTTKEAGRGTGLGLAMVFGSVKRHGGDVVLESKEGEGTTVTMLFPVLRGEEQAKTRAVERPESSQESLGGALHTRILVVDDEPLIRASHKRMLGLMGYEVTTAEDGQEALECYEELREEIGLVILDMAMPVMDGAECFRRLRELDPNAKVLIASGFSASADASEVIQVADGFLRKPFEMKALETTIQAILRSQANSNDERAQRPVALKGSL